MKHVRLKVIDDCNGTIGFVLKGTPEFEDLTADTDGLLIAHDLLEHQNGTAKMGPVWDELEALGGIWYCRGQHGNMLSTYGHHYSPEHHIAADVVRMFPQYLDEECDEPGGLLIGSKPHDHDEYFQQIITHARANMMTEHNDMGQGNPELEDKHGWTADMHVSVERYYVLTLHRMRAGFRKAQKRFEGRQQGQWNGYNLMRDVRDAVGDALKEAVRNDTLIEGAEFVLSYACGEGATCKPVGDAECWR